MEIIKNYLKKIFYWVCMRSLKSAAAEQKLDSLMVELEKIVPNIEDQYSTTKLDNRFLEIKARINHAFQISLVNKVMKEFQKLTIVDIGDSAGTHLQYILGLHSQNKDIKTLSINLDPKAIERIKAKGLNALNARAENLQDHDIKADVFICFQTLEHLMDPCRFLHQLATKTNAEYLIVTIPYSENSRVALSHIRQNNKKPVYAEEVHIFEFSPEDWKLIARHSGWQISDEKVYLQYPKRNFFKITKSLWKKYDLEGFYGLILRRDNTWSSKYLDW